ncbi:MAG TPA: winged helix-turn-helix domain-containing protein [Pyrinomonadaceae bacterium]|nr:winged helix-turn-helix domain-containing protein [Pyrinomonadaceae bacterium]
MEPELADRFKFGDFEIDRQRRTLKRSGETVPLNPKAFDLLLELVANRGDVVTKDVLLERVWPGQYVEENNLTVQISALRRVFGEKKGDNRFIVTVSGNGYKFVGGVDDESDAEFSVENRTIERILIEGDGRSLILPDRFGRLSPALVITIFVLVVIVALGAYRYSESPATPKIGSIAVLPFANETSNPDNEYLSDGLAESVTYSLSRVPGVRVMSYGSTYRYKGVEPDLEEVASDLNVEAILTGRVTQRGDTLTISAELVSATDRSILWGEQFSRKLANIDHLESDIAQSISSKLRFALSGEKKYETENVEAYRTYLEGLYYWNKRTPDDLRKSIELFERAIALDPKFSRAYGCLAGAWTVLESDGFFSEWERSAIRAKEKEAVARALEVDDTIVEAQASSGRQKFRGWDFVGAEAAFRRAIEINPNYPTAHEWYSQLLSATGRDHEAMVKINRAYELDPFSRSVMLNMGLRHVEHMRLDQAETHFRKIIAMEPNYPMAHVYLAATLQEKGLFRESRDSACRGEVLLKLSTPEACEKRTKEFEIALAQKGAQGFWEKRLRIAQENARRGDGDHLELAEAYLAAGNTDKGFEHLEICFADRDPGLAYLKVNWPIMTFRDDPRYIDLLKRIGLPQ